MIQIDVVEKSQTIKLIAHRGWSEGGEENSLEAFGRAAADPRVSSVEFDVIADADGALVVAHDAPLGNEAAFSLDAALGYLAGTDLELFVEIKDAGVAPVVVERLVAAGVADRSVVFAFADIAQSFAWNEARPVRLGAVMAYPWTMRRFVETHDPDVILLGWDEYRQPWTRFAFRTWWSVFSLAQVTQRFKKPVVAGIVRRTADLTWLSRQEVYAATVDMDCIGAAAPS